MQTEMKINKYIILSLATAATVSLNSCDFLDREPLDFGNETSYFQEDTDLEIFVNDLYEMLPTNNNLYGGTYSEDRESDNQAGPSAQSLFYEGDKKVPDIDGTDWQEAFEYMRAVNYFINMTEEKYDDISGEEALIAHYLGEGYFFRAYTMYNLLREYGDAPIYTVVLEDDSEQLAQAYKRYPRNEVARFILVQCDSAISKMQDAAPESGRLCKDAARMLKSRVALFEATWEKYHAGTCFVPGNSKWPGYSYWPDFAWEAGSAEGEINYFLDQCIEVSAEVADARPLDSDYQAMFNSTDAFGDDDEVILARYYLTGVLTHSCSAYLKSGGGCGLTRALVNSFLMTNGLPIYDEDSGYQGDATSYEEFQGRDTRLTGSARAAGSFINTTLVDGKYVNDTVYYYKPYIWLSGNEKATTGYEVCKWLSDDTDQRVQYECTTSVPIFRSAEARLNYLEAYYLRYGNLGGNCDTYWRELRERAGVDTDYTTTIAATDLSQENDLAVYSKGEEIDVTLYNIRRERRCEYVAEGMRLDDLKRWRSLDSMVDYQIEGFNLWETMYTMYTSAQRAADVVSQSSVSTYIRPLQISSTSVAYGGYNFPKPHYLEPIPVSEFTLSVSSETGETTLYQNPGWPSDVSGTADYDYDCD